jgi:hypothetical protein
MEETKEKKNKLVPVLIGVIVLLLGGLAFLMMNNKEVVEEKDNTISEVVKARDSVTVIYNEASAESARLKGSNEELNNVLDARQKEIEASKARIDELIRTVKDKDQLIAAIKKERDKMRKLNAEYVERIDQLILENQALTAKKAQLEEEVSAVTKDRDQYKTKAEIGAKLKAEYVKVKALRERMMGDGMKETGMAKRTKKLDVSFSVLKNEIAVNGPRTVYLRVVTPTGVVMGNAASGSGKFEDPEKKTEVMFSSKKEFTYTGSQQDDIHLEYEEPNTKTFPEGEYLVEIYIDKMLASQTKVSLK